jgi:hypothetical protein
LDKNHYETDKMPFYDFNDPLIGHEKGAVMDLVTRYKTAQGVGYEGAPAPYLITAPKRKDFNLDQGLTQRTMGMYRGMAPKTDDPIRIPSLINDSYK